MASTALFTPFVDKENIIDAGARKGMLKSGHGHIKSHVGKTFQANTSQTPLRRVLGNVNRANIPKSEGPQQQKGQLKRSDQPAMCLQPPAPASKPPRHKTERPATSLRPPQTAPRTGLSAKTNKFDIYVDEIEKMPLPPADDADNFDHVWAAAERPATYLQELKEWRLWPFGYHADLSDDDDVSDEEEDSLAILDTISELSDDWTLKVPIVGTSLLASIPLPTWEELELEEAFQTTL